MYTAAQSHQYANRSHWQKAHGEPGAQTLQVMHHLSLDTGATSYCRWRSLVAICLLMSYGACPCPRSVHGRLKGADKLETRRGEVSEPKKLTGVCRFWIPTPSASLPFCITTLHTSTSTSKRSREITVSMFAQLLAIIGLTLLKAHNTPKCQLRWR